MSTVKYLAFVLAGDVVKPVVFTTFVWNCCKTNDYSNKCLGTVVKNNRFRNTTFGIVVFFVVCIICCGHVVKSMPLAISVPEC